MTPSRSAAIAATWGTPPESTAFRSTLSMADPSMDAFMDDLPMRENRRRSPGYHARGTVARLILMYCRREGQHRPRRLAAGQQLLEGGPQRGQPRRRGRPGRRQRAARARLGDLDVALDLRFGPAGAQHHPPA